VSGVRKEAGIIIRIFRKGAMAIKDILNVKGQTMNTDDRTSPYRSKEIPVFWAGMPGFNFWFLRPDT